MYNVHTVHPIPYISRGARDGFTLIELLGVLAIMALLLTGATIAFNSILSASGVDQAAQVLSHTFSLARTEAIARQTYTWVGINDINSNQDIQVCVVASVDGTATVGSNGSNLILLEPIRVIRHGIMHLTRA